MTRQQGPTPGTPADDCPPADPHVVGRAILLQQLTLGPRTQAQLRTALAKRNVPDDVAQQLLDRFTEVGLIDDAAYAEALIRSEAASGGLSRRRVAYRLRTRGVAEDVAQAAVATIDADEEYRAALDLARRRAGRLAGLDGTTARRRLIGVLARRGYPVDVVQRVVGEVLGEGSEGG